MRFDRLVAVIPISRMDPDPSEITDRVAEGTLASYQALWHPVLINTAGSLPEWVGVESIPEFVADHLLFIPGASCDYMGYEWEMEAENQGSIAISHEETREGFIERVRSLVDSDIGPWDTPAEDFYALGLARLWLEMLMTYLGHASTLDEDTLERETLAAAAAAVAGDTVSTRDHLHAAFETLLHARHQLYPVDIHIIDITLLQKGYESEELKNQLTLNPLANVMLTGEILEELACDKEETFAELKRLITEKQAEVILGGYDEKANHLDPLEDAIADLTRAQEIAEKYLGRYASVYGRRSFAMSQHMYQIALRCGMQYGLHFCLDEGLFPDHHDIKLRYELPDATTVDLLARFPFSADNAEDFLKFPQRLHQTISSDFVATMVLAHLPVPESCWYRDLLRMNSYCPVFGEFTTISRYFELTEPPSLSTPIQNDEYLSAFLLLSHYGSQSDPISRFIRSHTDEARRFGGEFARATRQAISLKATSNGPDSPTPLDSLGQMVAKPAADEESTGNLVVNPYSQDRQIAFEDGAGEWDVANTPALGFCWKPKQPTTESTSAGKQEIVPGESELHWSNEFIEFSLDPATGGLRVLRETASQRPLLAQRLQVVGLRSESGSHDSGDGSYDSDDLSPDVEMVIRRADLIHSDDSLTIVSITGDLIAQPSPSWASSSRLMGYEQRYTLVKGRPWLQLDITFDDVDQELFRPDGGPWQSYVACRFAWPDTHATATRGSGGSASRTKTIRPETPLFVEVHDRRNRTAILTGGLPFHQIHKKRMLDTVLLTSTEEARQFRLALGYNLANPFVVAAQLLGDPMVIPNVSRPAMGESGWFFHLDTQNVLLSSMVPSQDDPRKIIVRLVETEGVPTSARLRCVREVAHATITDFLGQQIGVAYPDGDALPIEFVGHEMVQVEIEFC